MTRETKIGLLVSLAFVIAVGVLLSDHMVNNTDAKPVAVAKAGPAVAEALAVPGQPAEGVAAPVQPEANPVPVAPVPTVQDITNPSTETGNTRVVVGPSPTVGGQAEIVANPNVPQRQTDIHIAPQIDASAGTAAPETGVHVATLGGAPVGLVPADPLAGATTRPAAEPEKKFQEYVAVSGDNVAKWAKKFLGADTKANRDLIVAANDVLKKDPTKIVVGKTYRIPVKQAPLPTLAAVTPAATETPARTADAAPAPAVAKTYVVKSGDNLWKIAKGNEKLIGEIRKLNRDAFKDGNLKVGATLRLPAKNAG